MTASSDRFRAENGRKALTAMDASGITATFNPMGVLLRRWQLDDVHIQSGEVGMTQGYLEWLPRAEEVFASERGGYLWTTVHLSGTIEQPRQDLSPRIIEALKESPEAFLVLVFRQFGEWLKNALGAE